MKHYISVCLTIILASCSQIKQKEQLPETGWQNCYDKFEKHVLELSGLDAKDCGFFTVESSEADKTIVKNCLNQVVKTGNPFRIGHRSYGDDSMFCDTAIKDTTGKYWSFFYDSDSSGSGSGSATIWVSECSGIELKPGTIGRDSFFSLKDCNSRDDIVNKLLSL